MSAFKYLVVCLLVGTICSYPHNNRRYVRSPNVQMQQIQQPYSYPNQYPTMYQPYQPGFGFPNFPMGPSQPFPSYPQSNPWMMPSYPSYGSGYPSYPSYPSYPLYPSYPYQPSIQPQPDPYAHIPTEIIDVDVNGNFDLPETFLPKSGSPWTPDLIWGYSNQNSSIHNQTAGDTQRQVFTNTVTSKPFTATISRVYEPDSEDPKVEVRITPSKPGSGVLIEATGDINENTEDKTVEEENTADNQVSKVGDEKTSTDAEEEDETTRSSFIWG